MSQKRWVVELSFKDAWDGAPADSDWKPQDPDNIGWKDKELAIREARAIGADYHCFTRVRRTDEKTAPICYWPWYED